MESISPPASIQIAQPHELLSGAAVMLLVGEVEERRVVAEVEEAVGGLEERRVVASTKRIRISTE